MPRRVHYSAITGTASTVLFTVQRLARVVTRPVLFNHAPLRLGASLRASLLPSTRYELPALDTFGSGWVPASTRNASRIYKKKNEKGRNVDYILTKTGGLRETALTKVQGRIT